MDGEKCGFCHTGQETESVCGSLHKDRSGGKVIAAHHRCMQYSALLVQYKSDEFGGFKKAEVLREMKRGGKLACHLCKGDKTKKNKKGATSGCAWRSCRKTFHYYCVSMHPNTVAKRYKVTHGSKDIILYRVFCSKAHEEQYKKNLSAQDIAGQNQSSDEDDDKDDEDDDADDDVDNKPDDALSHDDGPKNDKDDAGEDNDTDDYEPAEKRQKLPDSPVQSKRQKFQDSPVQSKRGSSPGMSPISIVAETRREYRSLLRKQNKDSLNGSLVESPSKHNNNNNDEDSQSILTDDFNTSNNATFNDESDLPENGLSGLYFDSSITSPSGSVIVVPSRIGVTDLKTICQQSGYSRDCCMLWPSDAEGLEDKHLPYVMWHIASKLSQRDTAGLMEVFADASPGIYECLQDFHSRNVHNVNIHETLLSLTNKVNMLYKTEVCRLIEVSVRKGVKLNVLFLTLPNKIRKTIDLESFLSVYRWSRDTLATIFDDSNISKQQEKKTLANWLVPRVKENMELFVCPDSKYLQMSEKNTSVARLLQFGLESMAQQADDSSRAVKVMVLHNVDRSVVQFKAYMHKVVGMFVQENIRECDCYCVVEVLPSDRFRDILDVVPNSLLDMNVGVYSAFNPRNKPVSCLVVHVSQDPAILGKSMRTNRHDSEDLSQQSPSLYLDIDEQLI